MNTPALLGIEPRLVELARGRSASLRRRADLYTTPGMEDDHACGFTRDGRVAIVCVDGVIGFGRWWGCDTGALAAAIRSAADDPMTSTVLLDVHSPGGDVAGMSDLIAAVRYAKGKKRVCAVAHDVMASCAYWVSCLADEIAATPTALVGSIGAMVSAVDSSKAFEEAGLRMVVAASGKLKTTGMPGVPITPEQETELVEIAQAGFALFSADVAEGRRMKPEAIAALEAGVLDAARARAAGLVDQVAPFDDYLESLKSAASKNNLQNPEGAGTATAARRSVSPVANRKGSSMNIETLRQEHPDLVTQVETAALARAAQQPADFGTLDAAFGQADSAFVTEALRGRMTFAQAVGEYNKRQAARAEQLTTELTAAKAELEQLKAPPAPGAGARKAAKGEAPVAVNAAASGGGGAGQPDSFDAAVAAVAAEKGWSTRKPLELAQAKAEACKRYPALYEQHRADNFPRIAKSA